MHKLAIIYHMQKILQKYVGTLYSVQCSCKRIVLKTKVNKKKHFCAIL